MSEDELDADVLHRVGLGRREFVRNLLIGTAFAVPVIASFDMSTLTVASAESLTPNQTKKHTVLTATPAIETEGPGGPTLEDFTLTATLTMKNNGNPIPNKVITFTAGGHVLGTATTDENGVATLVVEGNPTAVNEILRAGGYKVHFAGTSTLDASSGSAPLIVINN